MSANVVALWGLAIFLRGLSYFCEKISQDPKDFGWEVIGAIADVASWFAVVLALLSSFKSASHAELS